MPPAEGGIAVERSLPSSGTSAFRIGVEILRLCGYSASRSIHSAQDDKPLLLVLDVHVLGVDHTFVFFLTLAVGARIAARGGTRGWTARCRSRRRLRRLVHLLGQLVRSLSQRLASLVHLRLVVRLQRFLGVG